GQQGKTHVAQCGDATECLGDSGKLQPRRRHGLGQIRKCVSIHAIPGALALVTTGPSVMMFFGMPLAPVFSPPTTAATPATIAPPWMRQDGLRTVACMRPSLTAANAGGIASQPPMRISVRLCAFITL